MSGDSPRPGAIPGWGQQAAEPAEQASSPEAPPSPSAAPESPPSAPPPATGWPTPPPSAPPPSTGWPTQTPPGGQGGWGQPSGGPDQPAASDGWGQTAPQGPPGQWNPAPAAGTSGCLKAFLIVIVLIALGIGAIMLSLVFFGNSLVSQFGGLGEGECTILSNEQARSVLGSDAEVLPLSGIAEATLGLVLDTRVLTDADDCFISASNSEAVGRVARYQGGDAAARFQAERQRAGPTSEDRGGGISVESEGYLGPEMPGVGDEAFCTGVSAAVQAGVVARRGDTIVYVSLSAAAGGTTDYEATENDVVYSPGTCERSAQLVRAILP